MCVSCNRLTHPPVDFIAFKLCLRMVFWWIQSRIKIQMRIQFEQNRSSSLLLLCIRQKSFQPRKKSGNDKAAFWQFDNNNISQTRLELNTYQFIIFTSIRFMNLMNIAHGSNLIIMMFVCLKHLLEHIFRLLALGLISIHCWHLSTPVLDIFKKKIKNK